MSFGGCYDSLHHSEERCSWRDGERSIDRKRKRSHGISPTSFHSSPPLLSTLTGEYLEKALHDADYRVERQGFKSKFEEFEKETCLKEWPLQDLALKNLDELLDFQKNRQNDTQDQEKAKDGDVLLWSHEPRIFALEKSGQGKRRYVVAHLGRFIHHYFRLCDSSARHYYELIREETPCRLYFGKSLHDLINGVYCSIILQSHRRFGIQ